MNEEDFINAFQNIVWYNGYYNEIQRWIKDGNEKYFAELHCRHIPCLLKDYDDNPDFGALQTIWMVCVSLFGDYGISPRYDWISDWEKCKDFLNKICEDCEEKGE